MRALAPGIRPRFFRSVKPLALGGTALLLVLALACGAAEQPQQPNQSAGQASQAQPATQGQPVDEPANVGQTGSREQTGESMVKSEETMKPEMGGQAPSEPMAGKEMTKEMTTDHQPASAEVVVEKAAEAQPEPVVKAVEPQAQPGTEMTKPAAPHQEPAAPTQPTEAAPAQVAEPTTEPAAAPQPAQAPVQQPTAIPAPQPTATPVAVVVEPSPDVGNKVGNRVPDLGLELVGGAMVSTSGLIEQGKPTFLFFTSTT